MTRRMMPRNKMGRSLSRTPLLEAMALHRSTWNVARAGALGQQKGLEG